MRTAQLSHEVEGGQYALYINLEGTGIIDIATGLVDLDTMLEELARHALIDITLHVRGDPPVDNTQLMEQVGVILGMGLNKALGARTGIRRYGFSYLPMEEVLTRAALDLSGSPRLVWRVALSGGEAGEIDSGMWRAFFQALAEHGGLTLHVETLYGDEDRHIVLSCFRALARALRAGLTIDRRVLERHPRQQEKT